MRSTAGIVAGLLFIGVVANCGGNDSNNGGNTGGSNNAAGQGGEGTTTGATSAGGTSTAGTTNAAGQGGTPTQPACKKDADCGATAKCVSSVCKSNDGEPCTASADCQNSCVDNVCTSKLDDGKDCTSDDQCVHTCIDGVCAPQSDLGGDCDVGLGAGGAGGASSSGVGGAGGDGSLAPVADCKAPLQCFSGKCLTPNGEACKDNIDCITGACITNVCKPKSTIDGACDDDADCTVTNAEGMDVGKVVCDAVKHKCKLDVLSVCQTNAQCQSNRCLCSDHTCSTRVCKTADSVCQCRYSATTDPNCDVTSPVLDQKTKDPNGCSGTNFCSAGNCVPDQGGGCDEPCIFKPGNPNAMPAVPDSCVSGGAPTGCNSGYHGNVTSQCAVVKGTQTCTSSCHCDLG